MSLPKISHPIFTIEVPSTKTKVRFRPFLVKEEKILLMAQASGNIKEIVSSLKQVVNNCAIDELDVDDLTTFDLEFIFIKLRAQSVNNMIELSYVDQEDGKKYDFEVNLNEVVLLTDPEHTNKIKVTDSIGIVLKYPKPKVADDANDVETELDLFFVMMKECIDYVYDDNKKYMAKDYTKEELDEFLSTLDVNTFKEIQKFFNTLPKLYYKIEYENEMGNHREIELKSLNDFFMLG